MSLLDNGLPFVKMHGLGNDFILLDAEALPSLNEAFLSKLAARVCHRQFGVGADGLIVAAPSDRADSQFIYFNSDGGRAEMCGNGIRCFARYLVDRQRVPAAFTADTLAGLIQPTVLPDGQVRVNMGAPRLQPEQIPFAGEAYPVGQQAATVVCHNQTIALWPVSMGNPHAIVFQADQPAALEPATWGPRLETHPAFPAKTNVEFVTVEGPQALNVTVWERGCGFTLACGTGACATAVAAILAGRVQAKAPVAVRLPGGTLTIEWNGEADGPVWMTGPAETVCQGHLAPALLSSIVQGNTEIPVKAGACA